MESCSKAISLLGTGTPIVGGVSAGVWMTVGSKAVGLGAGVWMERGFSAGRVWIMGRVRGVSEGCWQSKLLLDGFSDGVKCSRSLLCGLPPPTCL